MGFNFPALPAVGEVHTEFGLSYTWDGSQWKMGIAAVTVDPYVLKAGDQMLGPLVLIDPNPTAPLHSAHKRYVDEMVSTMSLWQGSWQVAANVPDLTPAVANPLHGFTWTCTTVDPQIPETAPAALPGIGGLLCASNDTVIYNATLAAYELIRTPLTQSSIEISDIPPPAPFPGMLWWESDTGKLYAYYQDIDTGQWVQLSGGGGGSGGPIPDDAPSDTLQYARQSATVGGAVAWTQVTVAGVTYAVPVGDVMPATALQGELFFNSVDASLYIWFDDGTSAQWVEVSASGTGGAPLDAYTKAEVDAMLAGYLPLTGGTLTGALTTGFGGTLRAGKLEIAEDDYNIVLGTGMRYNTHGTNRHTMYVGGADVFTVGSGGVTVKGTITDALGVDVFAELKSLREEITALKAKR